VQVDEIREWVVGQLAAATSAAWTAFECVATDTWVTALNAVPMTYYQGVLKAAGAGESPQGLTGKQISVGLLAKYSFDLRGHLGTLLKPKFDLTSLSNIRDAYYAAFGKVQPLADLFEDEDLNLLEACRHVIVHRGGIADAEFVSRTRRMNIAVEEGAPLPLDGRLVSKLANASTAAGCKLLAFLDGQLASEGDQSGSLPLAVPPPSD
jgi:hypothetical protein